MQLTLREILTATHGMLFGGFFLLALFALVIELVRSRHTSTPPTLTPHGQSLERVFLLLTATTGWLAVFTGTYLIYPWYRAKPPAGAVDLTAYPRSLLLAHPATAAWHSLGMEWKEHIAFFAPILFTMLAFVFIRHRQTLREQPQLRHSIVAFAWIALISCAVAATFGAMINKAAPVTGGDSITLIRSAQ